MEKVEDFTHVCVLLLLGDAKFRSIKCQKSPGEHNCFGENINPCHPHSHSSHDSHNSQGKLDMNQKHDVLASPFFGIFHKEAITYYIDVQMSRKINTQLYIQNFIPVDCEQAQKKNSH